MRTIQTPDNLRMPHHLTPWMKHQTLSGFVVQAVDRMDEEELWPVTSPKTSFAFRPRTLLAVMTYCYAMGIYGSQAIEARMLGDVTFRCLCEDQIPSWEDICRFRRHNHDALQRCLEDTLRGGAAPGDARPAGAVSAGRLAAGESVIREEAGARLEQAMYADGMSLADSLDKQASAECSRLRAA